MSLLSMFSTQVERLTTTVFSILNDAAATASVKNWIEWKCFYNFDLKISINLSSWISAPNPPFAFTFSDDEDVALHSHLGLMRLHVTFINRRHVIYSCSVMGVPLHFVSAFTLDIACDVHTPLSVDFTWRWRIQHYIYLSIHLFILSS